MALGTSVGRLFVEFGAEFSDLAKDVARIQDTFDGLDTKFTKAGTALSLAITAPLAGIGAIALKSFGEFEAALNKVSALQGIFGADLDKLKQQALDLGAQTQFSARQAADAMGEFAAQGFNATQIYTAMPGALSLAAAGQLKVADAANISAAILKGFNLETEKISDVANVLAKAAGESAVSVQDLGFSFKYVGPVASAAGVSFTETAAALAALGNAGIKGEMGGTAIRNMISDLIKPSKQAKEVLDAMKISVTDATGKFLPMGDVLQKLAPLANNLQAGFQVFGVRFSEVLPLLKLGKQGFEELNQKMIDASKGSGAATVMAQNLFKGWNAAIETFKGSVETTLIKIGDILAKPAGVLFQNVFTPLMNALGTVADLFARLPMPVQSFALALGAIAAAAGPAVLAVGGLMRAVKDLEGLPAIINVIGEKFFYGGLKIEEFGKTGSAAIKSFIAQFSAANIMQAGNNFKAAIVSFASDALATLKNLPSNTKVAVAGFAAALGTELASHASTIKTGFTNLFSSISSIDVGGLIGGIGPKISAAVAGITASLSGLSLAGIWSSVVAGFSSIGTAIAGFVSVAGSVALPVTAVVVAVGALAAIGYEVYKNWDQLTAVFAAFWTDIQNIVGAAAAKVGQWIDNALGAGTTSKIAAVWQSFTGFFSNLWSNIIGIVDKAMRFIVDQAQRAASALNLTETAKSLASWRDQLDLAAKGLQNVATASVSVGKNISMAFNFTGVDDARKKIAELNDVVKLTLQHVQSDITFQGLKNSAADAAALKSVLGQLNGAYDAVVRAAKEGKLTDKEASDQKAALANQVNQVKQQLNQLSNTVVPAATAAIGKHKKEVKDTQEVYKTWKGKVADALEDMAKSFDSFKTRVADGMNWSKEVKKLEEMLRDMGRAMEDAKTPAEKLKIALKMDEVAQAAQKYREFGEVLRNADIGKVMDDISRAANEIRSKKALDFTFTGLKTASTELEETKKHLNALGLEVGDVYQRLSGKDVKLQKLEEMQAAFDYAQKNAEKLKLTSEDLEKAALGLQKAKTDYYFAEIGGIEGVTKAFQALGQTPPPNIELRTDGARKALEELAKNFEIMKASGLASTEQLRDAYLNYLEKKLAAEKTANANIKIETTGLFGFISAKADESAISTKIAFLKGMKELQDTLTKDFGDVFGSIFEGNFGKAIDGLKTLGNNAFKNLKSAFLSPFEDAFKSTFNNIAKEVSRFVTENLVGGLMKGLTQITGGIVGFGGTFSSTVGSASKTAQSFAGVLGTASDSLTKSADNLTKAATQLSTAAGLGGQAAGAAGQAAGQSVTAAGQIGGAIASKITGALTNWVAPISSAVSAITDVIALFGQRRMEQDLGRIEVTTREIFSQLLSIQGDVNKYWPSLMNLSELQRFSFMEAVLVEMKQQLEVLVEAARDIAAGGGSVTANASPEMLAALTAIQSAVQQSTDILTQSRDLLFNIQDVLVKIAAEGFSLEIPALRSIADTLQQTDTGLRELDESLRGVDERARTGRDGLQGLREGIEAGTSAINEAITETTTAATGLGQAATSATEPLNSTVKALEAVPIASRQTTESLSDTGTALKETTKAADKVADAVKIQSGVFVDHAKATTGASNAVEKNLGFISNWEADLKSAAGATEDLSSAQNSTTRTTDELKSAIGNLENPMSAVAEGVAGTVTLLEASAEHYESKMADIGKKMSANVDIMDQTQAAMQNLGINLAGSAEQNRQQYYRIYQDMAGFSDQLKDGADRIDPAADLIANGFFNVGNAVTQGATYVAESSVSASGVVGAAMAQSGDMFQSVMSQGAGMLSTGIANLGNAVVSSASAAMASIAAAASAIPGGGSGDGPVFTPTGYGPVSTGGGGSYTPGSGAGTPISLSSGSGGGGGNYKPPEVSTAKPKAEPGEISIEEFQAKGYTAGRMGPGGGIIPYGVNGQAGGEPPKVATPLVPAVPTTSLESPVGSGGASSGPADLQQAIRELTQRIATAQPMGIQDSAKVDEWRKQLQEMQTQAAQLQQQQQTAMPPLRTVDDVRLPDAALPAQAYQSSPTETALQTLNVNVTVNNADAAQIAETIVERVRRVTGR